MATTRPCPHMVTAMAGLAALAMALGIGRFAFTPILPMMQEDAGLTVATGAWIASANYVGYLIGALSMIFAPLRPTSAIRAGLITIGLTTLGMGLTRRFGVWLGLRTVAGIASAWVLINVSAWCLAKLRRPLLNGMVFAGVGAGIALAGTLCLLLMRAGASSLRTWVIFGGLSLVIAAGLWPAFNAEGPTAPRPPAGTGRRGIGWDPQWVRLILCYGAFGFGYIIPATFLPAMARQVIRDPEVFGWSWPLFGAAAMGSTLATAALRNVVTNRHLWVASHLVMAVGIAVPAVWSGIVAIMLAALIVGGTFMAITMVGMQEARAVGAAQQTHLMAAMTSAFALGQIVGPLVVGFVVRGGGSISFALLFASALLVVSTRALSRPATTGRPPGSL